MCFWILQTDGWIIGSGKYLEINKNNIWKQESFSLDDQITG